MMNYAKYKRVLGFGLFLIFCEVMFIGCYPIELQLTDDGTLIIPREEGVVFYDLSSRTASVVRPGENRVPAFAVVSPDGQALLRAERNLSFDRSGVQTTSTLILTYLNQDLTEPLLEEELFSIENGTYFQWRPDGNGFSYTFVSSEKYNDVDENLPELYYYDLTERQEKKISVNSSALHKWLPDGSGLIFLQTEKKEENNKFGALQIYEFATGTERRVVNVVGAEWLELSPSGDEVVFSAIAVTAPGEEAVVSEDATAALYRVNLADGAFTRLDYQMDSCRYSPDGEKVAVLSGTRLLLTDRTWAEPVEIFTPVVSTVNTTTRVHATWLSATEVLVFREKFLYGVDGKSFVPQVVDVNTGSVRPLQRLIDNAISEPDSENYVDEINTNAEDR